MRSALIVARPTSVASAPTLQRLIVLLLMNFIGFLEAPLLSVAPPAASASYCAIETKLYFGVTEAGLTRGAGRAEGLHSGALWIEEFLLLAPGR